MSEMEKYIQLHRGMVIILLVRLQNADIPYVHSTRCREQMILFLAYLLISEDEEQDLFTIYYSEIKKNIEDAETAFKIMKEYSM